MGGRASEFSSSEAFSRSGGNATSASSRIHLRYDGYTSGNVLRDVSFVLGWQTRFEHRLKTEVFKFWALALGYPALLQLKSQLPKYKFLNNSAISVVSCGTDKAFGRVNTRGFILQRWVHDGTQIATQRGRAPVGGVCRLLLRASSDCACVELDRCTPWKALARPCVGQRAVRERHGWQGELQDADRVLLRERPLLVASAVKDCSNRVFRERTSQADAPASCARRSGPADARESPAARTGEL
eukprot:5947926-Pyramimonas_sp.AAC.1